MRVRTVRGMSPRELTLLFNDLAEHAVDVAERALRELTLLFNDLAEHVSERSGMSPVGTSRYQSHSS